MRRRKAPSAPGIGDCGLGIGGKGKGDGVDLSDRVDRRGKGRERSRRPVGCAVCEEGVRGATDAPCAVCGAPPGDQEEAVADRAWAAQVLDVVADLPVVGPRRRFAEVKDRLRRLVA
jgi:hypothetical protein